MNDLLGKTLHGVDMSIQLLTSLESVDMRNFIQVIKHLDNNKLNNKGVNIKNFCKKSAKELVVILKEHGYSDIPNRWPNFFKFSGLKKEAIEDSPLLQKCKKAYQEGETFVEEKVKEEWLNSFKSRTRDLPGEIKRFAIDLRSGNIDLNSTPEAKFFVFWDASSDIVAGGSIKCRIKEGTKSMFLVKKLEEGGIETTLIGSRNNAHINIDMTQFQK
ncbi:MAG: hypothetical protein OEX08_03280 [Candidatus Nomurabacteria bacterium]|nr:hypothetical protein [Candidatus Nomurabacteria bacterium]